MGLSRCNLSGGGEPGGERADCRDEADSRLCDFADCRYGPARLEVLQGVEEERGDLGLHPILELARIGRVALGRFFLDFAEALASFLPSRVVAELDDRLPAQRTDV